jgi:hypothetical protein
MESRAYACDCHAKAPILSRYTGHNFRTEILLEKLPNREIGDKLKATLLDELRCPPFWYTEQPGLS